MPLTVSSGDVSSGDVIYFSMDDFIELYAQNVTSGQNINSNALSYFKGILENQALPVDYVIYVGNTYTYNYNSIGYEYCMAYGDLQLAGTHFTGTGTICTMRVSGTQSVSYAYDQDIDLYAPMYYSRSNLGDYSGIYQYDWTGLLLLIFVVLGGVTWFIKKIMHLKY